MRLLRSSPGFSAVAVATIALAIGANAAMFSFVKGVLLSPLPYPDPERIVRVLERLPNGGANAISTLNYVDWATQSTSFEYIAAEAGWQATLTGGDEPTLIRGARVSAHYFDIFETRPALGRTFRPGDDTPGNAHVVLLNHVLWERRFGGDPAIVGRGIVLNGEPYTVVGILPEGGPFDRTAAQIWVPLAFEPSSMTRDFRWLGASAKLRPDVTLEQARAEMSVIGQRLAEAYPEANEGWGVAVDRLEDVLVGPDVETAVAILFDATLFILLIGCANLANLALARTIARERDVAMHAALGASRWRLVRQFLIENLTIAVCGGAAAVVVGYAVMRWIQSLIPQYGLPPAVDIRMDASVLLFTLVMAVVAGLLFGLIPAVKATRPNLVSALKAGGQGTTTSIPGRRVRNALVISEVAVAFVLLVASGLLTRSLVALLDVDPGFSATNVLTAGLPVTPEQHPDPVELNAYVSAISSAVAAVPGVSQTAVTSVLPLQGPGYGMRYSIANRELPDSSSRRTAFFKIVSPPYFEALGIRLLSGRALRDTDTAGSPPVTLINESLARREFPDEDPIGHQILTRQIVPGRTELGGDIAWEIVGVIAGEKITGLGDEINAGMYVSNQQSPTYGLDLVVRAGVPPLSLQKAIRAAIDTVNRDQALSDVRTLDAIVDQSMLGNRVMSTIFVVFTVIALLLAVMGIYGVVTYTAAQRTQEMGIRAALGAGAGNLRLLVLRDGMRLTLIGLVIGLAGTFAVTDVLSSMLYGIEARDPLTIVVSGAVLAGAAGLACFVPAWRMTTLGPMEALRRQ